MQMRNSLEKGLYGKRTSPAWAYFSEVVCSGDPQSCGAFQYLLETCEDQKLIFMPLL